MFIRTIFSFEYNSFSFTPMIFSPTASNLFVIYCNDIYILLVPALLCFTTFCMISNIGDPGSVSFSCDESILKCRKLEGTVS